MLSGSGSSATSRSRGRMRTVCHRRHSRHLMRTVPASTTSSVKMRSPRNDLTCSTGWRVLVSTRPTARSGCRAQKHRTSCSMSLWQLLAERLAVSAFAGSVLQWTGRNAIVLSTLVASRPPTPNPDRRHPTRRRIRAIGFVRYASHHGFAAPRPTRCFAVLARSRATRVSRVLAAVAFAVIFAVFSCEARSAAACSC